MVRLNFSHGDVSDQARRAAEVRAAAAHVGVEIGILADLPGPKIRIGRFIGGKCGLWLVRALICLPIAMRRWGCDSSWGQLSGVAAGCRRRRCVVTG